MTKRSALLNTLSGKGSSNPLIGWCDPWAQPSRENMPAELAEKLSNITWQSDRNIHYCNYLNISILDNLSFPVKPVYSKSYFDEKTEGYDNIKTWHTPNGEFKSIVRTLPNTPKYTVKHAIETPQDLEVFIQLLQEENFEINIEMCNMLRERKKLIGENGVLLCPMPGTPLGILIRDYAGVENTTFLSFDAPSLLKEYAKAVQKNHLREFATVPNCEMDGIINMDDTSTTTQSPQMFEEYSMDYTNSIADCIHKRDKLYIHHSCGLIKNLLPLYNQLNIDAVHAYSLNPVGDCEVSDKQILRDDIAAVIVLNTAIENIKDKKAMAKEIKNIFTQARSQKNIAFQLGSRNHWDIDFHTFTIEECKKYSS